VRRPSDGGGVDGGRKAEDRHGNVCAVQDSSSEGTREEGDGAADGSRGAVDAEAVFEETARSIRRRMQEVVRRHGYEDEKVFLSDYYVLSCERLCSASCCLPASFDSCLTRRCCRCADNLWNEAHLDSGDKSRCFSCFVEKYPGQAKRWFFHLPALGPHGTVIRLVSGLILAWDGREVMHCTGMSPDGVGADNMLHGYFVAVR
jgi:hypothetical protein